MSEGNFVFTRTTTTSVQVVVSQPAVYSLEAAAQLTGVHPDLLRHYCQLGLFGAERATTVAVDGGEPVFDDDALYELRRIDHYRRHHDVNLHALPLLIGLLREVERLQNELRFHRGR